MKDVLQDIVAHTHSLGFLSLVKITNEEKTKIESMAEDRSVILNANTNSKVNEFGKTYVFSKRFSKVLSDSSELKVTRSNFLQIGGGDSMGTKGDKQENIVFLNKIPDFKTSPAITL